MFIPALISVIAPLGVGLILGAEAEGGFIIGNIATILPVALQLMHSGTAWDNAKKYIEAGKLGGKRGSIHAAAVICDTVGDPPSRIQPGHPLRHDVCDVCPFR